MWERVLAVLADAPPPEATAAAGAVGFIHRDYHSGFLDASHTASCRELWHPYWDLLDAGDAILDMPDPNTAQERASYDRFEAWVEHVLRSC
jgi:hypothetical protein